MLSYIGIGFYSLWALLWVLWAALYHSTAEYRHEGTLKGIHFLARYNMPALLGSCFLVIVGFV